MLFIYLLLNICVCMFVREGGYVQCYGQWAAPGCSSLSVWFEAGVPCLLPLCVLHTSWLMSFQRTVPGHGLGVGWQGGSSRDAPVSALPHECRVYRHAPPSWLLWGTELKSSGLGGKAFDNPLSRPLCPTSVFYVLVTAGPVTGKEGGEL